MLNPNIHMLSASHTLKQESSAPPFHTARRRRRWHLLTEMTLTTVRPSVDMGIEVVKDAHKGILKGVPAFRGIMATEATTPPPSKQPRAPATGAAGTSGSGTFSTPSRATGGTSKIKAVTSVVQRAYRCQLPAKGALFFSRPGLWLTEKSAAMC